MVLVAAAVVGAGSGGGGVGGGVGQGVVRAVVGASAVWVMSGEMSRSGCLRSQWQLLGR